MPRSERQRTGRAGVPGGRPARRLAVLPLLLAVGLSACGSGGGSSSSARAAPAASERTAFTSVAVAVPAQNGAEPFNVPRRLTIPSGWSAEVWARVPGARFALWTPEGSLLVAASDYGELLELTPGTSAGAPPGQRVLATGLTMPEGMAFDTLGGQRVLYIAQSDQIDRYRWLAGGTLGPRTVVIANLPDTGPPQEDTHRLKSLAVGANHTIYFSIGSVSNAKSPDPSTYPPRASIMSISPNGRNLRVFARGVRNGEGLAFAPDGSLWTAVNERDEVPYPFHRSYAGEPEAFGRVIRSYVNEHPPDELARLRPGSNLGWPFCNPDPDDHRGEPERGLHYANLPYVADAVTNAGDKLLDCAKLAPLTMGLPGHSAPLGLSFVDSRSFAPFADGALLAVHGSWDRIPPRAPALLWLPWNSRTDLLGEPIHLVSGFQEASGARWGRPVDAVAGPDGAIYLTDDLAGAIYRIVPSAGG